MHPALKKVGFIAAMVFSGVILMPAGISYAVTGEEAINARIDFMKNEMDKYWRPISAFAKSGTGSLGDVEKNAEGLAKLAEKIPEHFPKDTGRGNYSDKMTRSLPAIWTDAAGFKKAVQALADGSEKLARLAKEGNKDAVVAMIGPTGSYARTKIGCAECHDKFRGPSAKE